MSSGPPPTQSPRVDPPAWRSPVAWATLILVAVSGLALDLWSKSWAFENVGPYPIVLEREEVLANPDWRPPAHEGVVVLPFGLLDFDLVLNHGAVFGIAAAEDPAHHLHAGRVLVATFIFSFWTRARSHWVHVGIGLILAGGIGNLYDRILFGAVRDFLHMTPEWNLPFSWHWPNGSTELFPWVFNVADVLLLVGMGILIIRSGRDVTPAKGTGSTTDHADRGGDVEKQVEG